MSGFGLNALMQGLPAGFAFGQQLAGQDAESRNMRMRERLGYAELAMREAQERERAQQTRDALEQEKEKLRIMEEANIRKHGLDVGQLKLDEKKTGILGKHYEDAAKYQTGVLNNQVAELNARAPLWKAQADTAQAQLDQMRDVARKAKVLQRLAADPFDPEVPDAERDEAFRAIQFHIDPQVQAVGREMNKAVREKGADALKDPALQKKLLNLPTLRAALNQGLNLQDSQGNLVERIEPEGIEPVEGGARIPITVIKRDPSGKPLPPQRSYVTYDRKAMVDGGQPMVFSPQQLSGMFAGVSKVGDGPGLYDAIPQQLREAAEDYMGATSESDVVKSRYARAKAKLDAKEDAVKDTEHENALRSALGKDVAGILTRAIDLENLPDGINPNEMRGRRAAIEQRIRGMISRMTPDQLRRADPDQLINAVAPDVAELYRSAQGAPAPTAPSVNRGQIYNPRSSGLGGGSGPFPR